VFSAVLYRKRKSVKSNQTKVIRVGLAAVALLCAQVSRADQQVTSGFSLPIHVNAVVEETACENHPGPTITLSGEIKLGGVKARLTFMNNAKGTHTATVVSQYDVALLLEGSTIEIPKQPVEGGVGGNPHISLQFHDGNGTDLSEEFYLGRCVQGLNVSTDLLEDVVARANVHADGCSNRKGPFITMDGDLALGGLHARIIFRNNVKGTHTAEDSRDVALVLEGSKIVLPKQPVKGGVGGNPIISIQFLQGDGTPIGEPTVLGRCVQL
jgi:hypothetical protein